MLFGSLVGALIAWRKSFRLVQATLPVLMVTAAVPFFLFGLVLQFFLGVHWKIFPTAFGVDPGFIVGWDAQTLWQMIKHAILPASAVIVASTGLWGLGMRAMMVTTAGEDYMVMGDSKGLKESRLFLGYAVRNVLLPQTTSFALSLASVVRRASSGGNRLQLPWDRSPAPERHRRERLLHDPRRDSNHDLRHRCRTFCYGSDLSLHRPADLLQQAVKA